MLGCLAGAAEMARRSRRARAAERRQAVVVEVCEAMVGELRAGQPLVWSLEHCVEVWPDLEPALAAARLGADVPTALRRLARLPGAEALEQVAAAWQVSQSSGRRARRCPDAGLPVRSRGREHPAPGPWRARLGPGDRTAGRRPAPGLPRDVRRDRRAPLALPARQLARAGLPRARLRRRVRRAGVDRPDRRRGAALMSAVTAASSLVAVAASALGTVLLLPGRTSPALLSVAAPERDDPSARADPPVLRLVVTVSVGLAGGRARRRTARARPRSATGRAGLVAGRPPGAAGGSPSPPSGWRRPCRTPWT